MIGHYETLPFPTEGELARQLGVSRLVTREAVKMLTAKGLLSACPRQGTIVQPAALWNLFESDVMRWLLERKFSVELLRQFSELRVAIEPEAAALAARCGTGAEHAAINAGLERMVAADSGAHDPLEADIAFHFVVLATPRNPFDEQFDDMMATALRTSIRMTNRIKGRSASIEQHGAVHDAIAARNIYCARETMRRIIGDVIELIDRIEAEDAA